MKLSNKKSSIFAFALLFIMLASALATALPTTKAHTPAWTIPTYSYITVDPDPVGLGQNVFVVFWVNRPPPTATGITGDRWRNLSVEVTKPDGSKETLGPFNSDPIGGSYTIYKPTQLGTYTF